MVLENVCRWFWTNFAGFKNTLARHKSQKLLEHQFRLKWTKCSPRIKFKPLKTSQNQRDSDKAAQNSPPEEVGGGWSLGQAGRPAVGPTALRLLCGSWGLAYNVGLLRNGSFSPMAPCYKCKGGREWEHTHTHTHTPFNTLTSCIVFRLSGV